MGFQIFAIHYFREVTKVAK